jgi:hypothetical protein
MQQQPKITQAMIEAGLAVYYAREHNDENKDVIRRIYDEMERVRLEERGRPSLWPDYQMRDKA